MEGGCVFDFRTSWHGAPQLIEAGRAAEPFLRRMCSYLLACSVRTCVTAYDAYVALLAIRLNKMKDTGRKERQTVYETNGRCVAGERTSLSYFTIYKCEGWEPNRFQKLLEHVLPVGR
jgi:hypothetical protein